MRGNQSKFIYWTPRVLSIIILAFMALMSLDVISPELSFWQIVLGMFMHNIPMLVLLALFIVSWKREIVGGVTFVIAGLLYVVLLTTRNQFEWYMLSWSLIIAGPAFLTGILFIIGWRRKKMSAIKK